MDIREIDEFVDRTEVESDERDNLNGHSMGNGVAYNLFAKVPTANRVGGGVMEEVGGNKIGKTNLWVCRGECGEEREVRD